MWTLKLSQRKLSGSSHLQKKTLLRASWGLLGPLHYLVLHNWMEISIVTATSLGSLQKDARKFPESVSFFICMILKLINYSVIKVNYENHKP